MHIKHLASALALAGSLSACGGGGGGGGDGTGEGRVITPAASLPPAPAAPDPAPTSEPATPTPTPTPSPAPTVVPSLPSEGTLATPETLAAILGAARSGDTIVLAPGDYGPVALPRVSYSPALRIDASRARLSEVVIFRTGGVEWTGGTLKGDREQTWSVRIDTAERVRISGMSLSGAKVGIGVSRSSDVEVSGNRFDGIRHDGVNIAMSQRVQVLRNMCINFDPVLPIYDPTGKLITDGDHPDCVQGWSRVGYPLTSDILIEDNVGVGTMQGVFFEDYGDGGYDRVTVRGNDFTLGMFQGININNGRDTVITGNRVRPVPGSRLLAYPYPAIRPWIRAVGERLTMCGNQAESYPADEPANQPCR